MNELFLYVVLIILITTFADKDLVSAIILLVLNGNISLVNIQNLYLNVMMNSLLPGISGLGYLITSYDYIKGVNLVYTIIISLIVVIIVVLSGLWYNSKSCFVLNSRRMHKSYNAMKIIYAMIFLAAAYLLMVSGFGVSTLSTLLIFALSLFMFFKFDISPIILMIISSIITFIIY